MKNQLASLLQVALNNIITDDVVDLSKVGITIETSKNPEHGDFASNLALILSKHLKQNPRQIAEQLVKNIPNSEQVDKIIIAGAGFINFFINKSSQTGIIKKVLEQKHNFGSATANSKSSVCIEFVSANPTGPLHVGHGRGAAFGDSLANLLRATGHKVHTEYYINDAGRQMDILATSVWLRYLSLVNPKHEKFPSSGYQGDYVWDIAVTVQQKFADKLYLIQDEIYQDIVLDEAEGGDKEQHIDGLITKAKDSLKSDYQVIFELATDTIVANIASNLSEFRVNYDAWFSEKSLSSKVYELINILEQNRVIYSKQGTKWFKTTEFGDDKDRVVVRSNGLNTYFASDIAYHQNKAERGFDQLINILGADHHGYIKRVVAGMDALGIEGRKLQVLLVQFANLFRNGVPIPMSTRSGSFVTLAELYCEVGVDAARFFYVERKPEQHLDFDLELAKSKNSENPVYYIQYAHARVFQVLQKLEELKQDFSENNGLLNLRLLMNSNETSLINKLSQYPDILQKAANKNAPHRIATYLKELAHEFHGFYNSHKIIIEDNNLKDARVCLIIAVAQVIANGLKIIGVEAPEKM